MDSLLKYLTTENILFLIERNGEIKNVHSSPEIIIALEKYKLKPETIKEVLLSNPRLITKPSYDMDDILKFLCITSDNLDDILNKYPEIMKIDYELLETYDSNEDLESFIDRIIT